MRATQVSGETMPADVAQAPVTFTWVPIYGELARLLAKWENRQGELIAFLETLKNENYLVGSFVDQDPPGNKFLLKEIDPWTVFGTFNRGGKDENRRAIVERMKQQFGAESPLPEDFHGIPVVNPMSSWFIAYQFHRDPKDVARLWKVFQLALGEDPLNNPEFLAAFDEAITVRQIKVNLTMGLFWIRPETFLGLDKNNQAYLDIKLPSGGLSADFYRRTILKAAQRGKPFSEISYQAWLEAREPQPAVPMPDTPLLEPVETRPTTRYWAMSLGEGGRLWNECRKEGIAAMGWDYLGDLRQYADKEAIGKAMQEHDKSDSRPTNNALACFQFCREMAKGDIIFAKQGLSSLLGCGVITDDYDHDPTRAEYFNIRPVDWVNDESQEIPEEASVPVKTLTEVTDYPEFLAFALPFLKLAQKTAATPLVPKPYTIHTALKDVFLGEDEFRLFVASLNRKKNAILQGPPGVGKTFIAHRLAYLLMGSEADDQVEMVQFHQSYSYEDFVQGWRPNPKGGFDCRNGVFYEFCMKARRNPDPEAKYVFIIDEINRANLSKVFGELFMLIEADKRGAKWAVPLTYTPGQPFYVPANLYLLGLMNTADRSLAMVDYALRRRFTFMDLRPAFDRPEFQSHLTGKGVDAGLVDRIVTRMTKLNDSIRKEKVRLGEGFEIGHSFFCPQDTDETRDLDWYRSVVRTEIAPLIREYWFDEADTANTLIEDLLQ